MALEHAVAEAAGLQQCSAGLALPRCLQRSRRPNRRDAEQGPCDGITTDAPKPRMSAEGTCRLPKQPVMGQWVL